jgi:hypothetical protein
MSKHARRITVGALMALMVPLASLGAASPALATPKGVFSVFADCPLATFKALGVPPGVALCEFHQVTSGELAIGSTRVPINQPITLQGGAVPTGNPENEKEYFSLPAADGNSLSRTELPVPGGLRDLISCKEINGRGFRERVERRTCRELSGNRRSRVTATVEAVANTENPVILNLVALVREEGTAITFPVRVHLKNELLGASCYIGSEASPIQTELRTGATSPLPPNTSIKGAAGAPETLEEYELLILRVAGNSLVANEFSVPVAEGCGESFSSIIDPILDGKLGLPSADGRNSVVLSGTLEATTAEAVEADEKKQEEAAAKTKQEEASKPKRSREKWRQWMSAKGARIAGGAS